MTQLFLDFVMESSFLSAPTGLILPNNESKLLWNGENHDPSDEQNQILGGYLFQCLHGRTCLAGLKAACGAAFNFRHDLSGCKHWCLFMFACSHK